MTNRFKVLLLITCNNQKIAAIREIRSALGIGLVLSRRLVEQHFFGPYTGGYIIVNEKQLDNLRYLAKTNYERAGCGYNKNAPFFYVDSVEILDHEEQLDLSAAMPAASLAG